MGKGDSNSHTSQDPGRKQNIRKILISKIILATIQQDIFLCQALFWAFIMWDPHCNHRYASLLYTFYIGRTGTEKWSNSPRRRELYVSIPHASHLWRKQNESFLPCSHRLSPQAWTWVMLWLCYDQRSMSDLLAKRWVPGGLGLCSYWSSFCLLTSQSDWLMVDSQ